MAKRIPFDIKSSIAAAQIRWPLNCSCAVYPNRQYMQVSTNFIIWISSKLEYCISVIFSFWCPNHTVFGHRIEVSKAKFYMKKDTYPQQIQMEDMKIKNTMRSKLAMFSKADSIKLTQRKIRSWSNKFLLSIFTSMSKKPINIKKFQRMRLWKKKVNQTHLVRVVCMDLWKVWR